MDQASLRALAGEAGLAVDWTDANDRPQTVTPQALKRILDALGLPSSSDAELAESRRRIRHWRDKPVLVTTEVGRPVVVENHTVEAIDEPGYHMREIAGREVTIAVAPPRCVTVEDIAPGEKLWGIVAQIYSLRRPNDEGFGDSGALCDLIEAAGPLGCDAVALSPTHALFANDLTRYSPYAPSSRLFLNPLLADPAAALGVERVAAVSSEECDSSSPLIDWPCAARTRLRKLRQLFEQFRRHDLAAGTGLAHEFEHFSRAGGAALQAHATHQAAGKPEDVAFHLFLQWIADRAFAHVETVGRGVDMRIGPIADLAIGLDPSGSEVAARPEDYLRGLSVGAPPDAFNARGQDWGLTTFSPQALYARGFAPFLDTLRATLRHAGGVRIDHAMGLMRLWLVPHGCPPTEGAYLTYPLDDLLRLLALESHRHGAVVIGEDLGTVPPAFRARCRDAGIAGMDVMWFEREGDRFRAPAAWRPDGVAMTTTHDLPTVAGWWRAQASEREALWQAFGAAGAAQGPMPAPDDGGAAVDSAVDAAVDFVARAADTLALVPLEDMLGVPEQPNVPGTIDEHPNWRRRLAPEAANLFDDPGAARRVQILQRHRP